MRVSVVIPCRNAERFLREAVESVLAQTVAVDEILVSDDGSSDRSASIAASFGPPVHVIRQPHQGVSAARNCGIAATTGAFVGLLDADDLWCTNKLDRQLAYLDAHPEVGAVGCSVWRAEGTERRLLPASDAVIRSLHSLDFLRTVRVQGMSSTWLMRGNIARCVPFPAGVAIGEDIIHSALLRARTHVGAIEEPLAVYRYHSGQCTTDRHTFIRSVRARLAWAAEHFSAIGATSATEAQAAVLSGAVDDVLTRYWVRDLRGYRAMRTELLALWPADWPRPRQLDRRLFPEPLLRLKDAVDEALTHGIN